MKGFQKMEQSNFSFSNIFDVPSYDLRIIMPSSNDEKNVLCLIDDGYNHRYGEEYHGAGHGSNIRIVPLHEEEESCLSITRFLILDFEKMVRNGVCEVWIRSEPSQITKVDLAYRIASRKPRSNEGIIALQNFFKNNQIHNLTDCKMIVTQNQKIMKEIHELEEIYGMILENDFYRAGIPVKI